MAKRRKPPKSRIRERAARAPRLQLVRFERSIARYLDEVRRQKGETARSHRFSALLHELFGDLPLSPIHEYLAGLETRISTHEGEKCRVLRGRPDALFGNLVIEFESRLPAKLKEAKAQLERYTTILRKNPATAGTYFIPVATDGVSFRVFAPSEGAPTAGGDSIALEQIEHFELTESRLAQFYYWLDRHFLRREERKPSAENILEDFGTDSPAFRESAKIWTEAVERIREHSDFKVIYKNWRNYLRVAYGSVVGDEQLFIRHTYLATLAKFIAFVRITEAKSPPEEHEVEEIILGKFFENKGILNFLEEDFFSWVARPAVRAQTLQVVAKLLHLLFTYNLREISEDVLKELYQKLVDPKDRHDLGEYYTPDWLAAWMCQHLLDPKANQSVLDPACGSGTFLYQVIQHRKRHLPPAQQLPERMLENVVGIDIHPLAVIVSKINVLLALGDVLKKRRRNVSIQVYLANSVRPPKDETIIGEGGAPARRVPLNDHQAVIPAAALETPDLLDVTVRVAQDFAKSHEESEHLDPNAFAALARREAPELAASPHVLKMWFELSALLHEFIRRPEDTIWAYILKNVYKPTFFRQRFDVVIGNPPWLSFRYVERGEYQDDLKRLIITEYRLLEGAGHLITHLELGTLFFVRCAHLYLKPQGKIGFVLPRSIFTADQHDRFRRSMVSGNITLTEVWDLEDVEPLFNVPAAVAFGDQESEARSALPGRIFAGSLRRANASLEEAKADLTVEAATFHVVQQGKRTFLSTDRKRISAARSHYQPYFKEGATIVPRSFWFVEIKADPKLGLNPAQPLVATDPRAKAEAKKPYNDVHFEGPVEAEFLYATLLSTDLLPFGHFPVRPVVLPLVEDAHGYRMLTVEQARREGFLRLAEWLERAQELWVKKRGEKAAKMDIWQRLDVQRGLTDQDPRVKYVVLYPMSATYLCAATVSRDLSPIRIGQQMVTPGGFLADYVNFYFETDDRAEALYITAVLNAPFIDEKMKPLQARGLWGPRHICKKVLELPIPQFNAQNPTHMKLSKLAEQCAKTVEELIPDLKTLFADMRGPRAIGRARTKAREALADQLAEIDSIVKKLLK